MSLEDEIRSSITKAVKLNNQLAKDVLRLVISDANHIGGTSDENIIKSCRKIIEGNNETIKHGGDNVKLRRENELLRSYIPKEYSLEEIQIHVDRLSSELRECKSDGKAIGLLSKALKDIGVSVSGDTLKAAVLSVRSKYEQKEA